MKKTVSLILIFISLIVVTLPIYAKQSPYKLNWRTDGFLFGGCIAIGFTTFALNNDIEPLTVAQINSLSRNNINWLDKYATYNYSYNASLASDFTTAIYLSIPLALFISEDISSDFETISIMYFETLLLASFVPYLVKEGVERTRPLVYNPDVPIVVKREPYARKSFPSRHTSVVFSTAFFFSIVYNDYYSESKWVPYIWGSNILAACAIGYLRFESGAHFPTDILTGAAIGSAIGYIVPYLHRTNNKNISITPRIGPEQFGLLLQYKF